METIKPNRLAECQKQASGFDVEIPTEISALDAKRFYHLVLIEQVHRPTQKRYDDRLSIIKMNQIDYISKVIGKSSKGSRTNTMALLGYENLFVLHDPTVKEAPKKKAPAKKVAPKKEETPNEEA